MIVLNLACHNGHAFEGWFASRAAFDQQCSRGLVQCAHCASEQVSALPSGPRVLRHTDAMAPTVKQPVDSPQAKSAPPTNSDLQHALQALTPEVQRKIVETLASMARGAEDVGQRFPEEARRIHYEEAPARTIRGQATAQETLDLLEEGILVMPALVPPEGELH